MSTYQGRLQDTETQVVDLRAQLAQLKKTADTYDREFLDRSESGGAGLTMWRRWGLSTLQDWVLAAFFFTYFLLSIAGVVVAATTSKSPLTAAFIAILLAFTFGVMISSVILRFA